MCMCVWSRVGVSFFLRGVSGWGYLVCIICDLRSTVYSVGGGDGGRCIVIYHLRSAICIIMGRVGRYVCMCLCVWEGGGYVIYLSSSICDPQLTQCGRGGYW